MLLIYVASALVGGIVMGIAGTLCILWFIFRPVIRILSLINSPGSKPIGTPKKMSFTSEYGRTGIFEADIVSKYPPMPHWEYDPTQENGPDLS